MTWAPDYVTTEQLAAYVKIDDTADNAELAGAITAASRAVDQYAGRQFGQVDDAEMRVYPSAWDSGLCRWFVRIDDLMVAPTEVATDPDGDETFTGDVGTAFVLRELNAAAKSRPWTRLDLLSSAAYSPSGVDRLIAVTALWGWSAVPSTVQTATLIQASRFFKRRSAPFGIAGPTADGAPALRLLSRVDPDVEAMLRPYRRVWAVTA